MHMPAVGYSHGNTVRVGFCMNGHICSQSKQGFFGLFRIPIANIAIGFFPIPSYMSKRAQSMH
jgi:hypothetical protein